MRESREHRADERADWFRTTHWSVVQTAGEGETSVRREALEKLCSTYWYPLYAYSRRKGHDEHEAQDLTQEFFARLRRRYRDLVRREIAQTVSTPAELEEEMRYLLEVLA